MELPCLALHSCDRSTSLFSIISQQKTIDTDEFLRSKAICPAPRGFLLVRDPDSMSTVLWRPHDGEQVHLPPLEGMEDGDLVYSQCHLSDDPSAPGWVVVVVEGCENTFMWYCHPGDDQWVKYEYDIGGDVLPYPEGDRYDKTPICPMAACRGKFYFNSKNELCVLEFCPGPVFSSIPLVEESDESEDDYEGYQEDEHEPQRPALVFHVESAGDLYTVTLYYASIFSKEIAEGFVDKMDFAERRWRRVNDLGGRTFFLSRFYFGASCSCGDESVVKQDCVYMVTPRKKEMLVFDVKDGTLSLHNLDEAPLADKAFWLLPKEDEETCLGYHSRQEHH